MPNITGYTEHPQNPGWISLTFDDGTKSPYAADPDGSFRNEATQVAQKISGQVPGSPAPAAAAPLASNPLAMPAPAPGAPPAVVGAPESIARPGLPPSQIAPAPITGLVPDVKSLPATDQAALHSDQRTMNDDLSYELSQQKSREAAARQQAADRQQMAGAQPYQLTQTPAAGGETKIGATWQTSGLSPEDKKKVDAANAKAVQTEYTANTEALKARTQQLNDEWDRLTGEEKKKLAEETLRKQQEADFTTKVDAQTRKMNADMAKPVDPSLAFKGAGKYYAFMAAFGDAVQNFGAALMGHGPVANPGAHIDSIVENSVAQQTAQKELMFREGKLTADQLNADREYVRAQLATVGKQLADVQLQKAKTQEEKTGLSAMAKKFDADRDAAIAKNAAATARTLQAGGNRETTLKEAPGGVSLFLGEKPDWDAVKSHSERHEGVDQQERGLSRLEKAAGWTWDEKANNGAGGYVGQDGKPVDKTHVDLPGWSVGGPRVSIGADAREVRSAVDDLALGQTKAEGAKMTEDHVHMIRDAMNVKTDAEILAAAERAHRELRTKRAQIDSAYSPGVVNAARYRQAQERQFENNQPGLPRSRPANAEELRNNP